MEIQNTRGELTAYGLACGYVERVENGKYGIELARYGGGQKVEPYYVQITNYDYVGHPSNANVFYEQYQTLTQARKSYRNALKSYA
jgi:hypothetical protein